MIGGRDRDRTGDPLLAKIGRTKNQQLTRRAMNCYRVLQVQQATAVGTDAHTLRSPG